MEAGHNAGIFTIAVNTGPLDGQVLLDAGADLLLPSMQALSDHWDTLFEKEHLKAEKIIYSSNRRKTLKRRNIIVFLQEFNSLRFHLSQRRFYYAKVIILTTQFDPLLPRTGRSQPYRLVLYIRPHWEQTRLRRRNDMVIASCHQAFAPQKSFGNWIGDEKRILLHAGGQSRRLPSYGPSGKILTPIPIFSWERGQKLGQNLLSLQLPLYERIMNQAPAGLNTLIASGDVYIRSEKPLQDIPNADVVCYGLWVNPSLATHHGVFVSDRKNRRCSISCCRNLLWKSWKDCRKLIFS